MELALRGFRGTWVTNSGSSAVKNAAALVYITRAIICTNHLSRGQMGEPPTEPPIRLLLEWRHYPDHQEQGWGSYEYWAWGSVTLASIYLGAILLLEGQIQVRPQTISQQSHPEKITNCFRLGATLILPCRSQALILFTSPEPFLDHVSHHYLQFQTTCFTGDIDKWGFGQQGDMFAEPSGTRWLRNWQNFFKLWNLNCFMVWLCIRDIQLNLFYITWSSAAQEKN